MTITFVSVFLNHHQVKLCEELRKYCDEFYFISTKAMSEERLAMGYKNVDYLYDYVIRTYDGTTGDSRVAEILIESDVVIFGDCDNKYIERRMQENKLSFLYSERFFKKGLWRRFIPRTRRKVVNRVVKFKKKNLYVLCASAFLSFELKLLGFDTDKCYKWGYFPEGAESKAYTERNNDVPKVLWAGRMIDWKHPDHAIKAAAKLKAKGCDFSLDMIGNGKCEEDLKKLASKLDVEDRVRFLGAMPPEQVLKFMEKADVFLVTSNCKEGWGAVVNESMSSGCAVLASSEIGSVPFLIEDGKNGLIYSFGKMQDFTDKLETLIKDAELRKKLGKAAVKTMKDEYNYTVAVKRFVEFIENGCKENSMYKSGPMSKAAVIKNKWYKL